MQETNDNTPDSSFDVPFTDPTPQVNKSEYSRFMRNNAKKCGYEHVAFCNRLSVNSLNRAFNTMNMFEQTILSQRHLFKVKIKNMVKMNRSTFAKTLTLVKRVESKLINRAICFMTPSELKESGHKVYSKSKE